MGKIEAPLQRLEDFIPPGSSSLVLDYLHTHRVHLTITRSRKSVLGDYRHPVPGRNHRISVNGNLNTFSFLITLIHELAHLVTFEQYGNRVAGHGREWKLLYRKMLEQFLTLKIFPDDIVEAIHRSLHNLPATSCGDEDLMRVLRRYDRPGRNVLWVEEVAEGSLFRIEGGQVFRKGKKMRKRYQCEEVQTGKLYLFSAIYEVVAI